LQVDFGNVAKLYALYRNDLPGELLKTLKLRGVKLTGKKVVDLGAGTGVLSRALYKEGAEVIGIEPSKELIEEALKIDQSEGFHITYENTYSEDTFLPKQTFDYVMVLRAWHWFDSAKTLQEINRIIKENGKLIIMDSGFTAESDIVKDTLSLIRQYMPNQELKRSGSKSKSKQLINSFPVEWFKEWEENKFDLQETYKFYYHVVFSNKEWCGRVGSLSWLSHFSPNERKDILNELYKHLKQRYGEVQHNIQHGCYVTILNRI